MTMLAPGVNISAGGVNSSGTDHAAAFVVGAIAVLRAASPSSTPDQIVQASARAGQGRGLKARGAWGERAPQRCKNHLLSALPR
jgi:subtilisin family serine protease